MKKYFIIPFILIALAIYFTVICGCGCGGGGSSVTPGEPAQINTPTPLSGSISGRVMEQGSPVSGAFAGFYSYVYSSVSASQVNYFSTAVADSDGRFKFSGLPCGEGRLEVWRSQNDYNSSPGAPAGAVNCTVGENTAINIEIGTVEPTVAPTATPTITPTPTPSLPHLTSITDGDGDDRNSNNNLSSVSFTLRGTSFGNTQGSSSVRFVNVDTSVSIGANITYWSTGEIRGNIMLPGGRYAVRVSVWTHTTSENVYYYKGSGELDLILD